MIWNACPELRKKCFCARGESSLYGGTVAESLSKETIVSRRTEKGQKKGPQKPA